MIENKKLFLGLILILIMIITIISIFLIRNFNEAEQNQKSILRTQIEDKFYEDLYYEECEKHGEFINYDSKEECEKAVKCVVERFVEIVAEEELEELHDYMVKNGGERGYYNYLKNNPNKRIEFLRGDALDCVPAKTLKTEN